jgi:hypothetical protein
MEVRWHRCWFELRAGVHDTVVIDVGRQRAKS